MQARCRRDLNAGVAVVALVMGIAGCGRAPHATPPVERMWPAMGSFASVAVPAAAEARIADAEDLARDAVSAVETELSGFIPESPVSRLNAAAGGAESLDLPAHAAAVFELSRQAYERSGGAFDPTVGPFLHAWGFRGTNALDKVPDAAALAAAAERVGWNRVEWRDSRARLPVAGMRLDFGGIAKGYGVDVAFERLRTAGYADVMVNLGGNLRCAGAARPGRKGWVVAVRDPFLPYGGGSVGTLTLTDGRATATSGRYERFVEIAGRRYAHIIDPRTAQPVAGLAQVTVVAGTAGEADALSTALFVLGPEAGLGVLRSYPGSAALFVPDPPEGQPARALATPGFLDGFTTDPAWEGHVERWTGGTSEP